jgi:hypothetical protein
LRKATDEAIDLRDAIARAELPGDGQRLVRSAVMVQREVAMSQRGLAESVDEMEWNQLSGPEAIQLIRRNVIGPLERLAEHDLVEQRGLLESLSRDGSDRRADAVQRQAKIVADMKQVLENISQWDSFVDVVNQLDTVIKLQSELRDATEEMRERDVESVFDE